MLKLNVTETAETELATPIVLALKREGSFLFLVDYLMLYVLTECDSYPYPESMSGWVLSETH